MLGGGIVVLGKTVHFPVITATNISIPEARTQLQELEKQSQASQVAKFTTCQGPRSQTQSTCKDLKMPNSHNIPKANGPG